MARLLIFTWAQFNDQPQRRLRCAAALMTTMGASLLLLCFAPPGLGGDAAVMAGCGFLLWMAGVAALLLSFLVQFDEQPGVKRLLRGCSTAAMVIAASVLVHGIPDSGGNANQYGAVVMAGCFFLLWMAGVALLPLSLVF